MEFGYEYSFGRTLFQAKDLCLDYPDANGNPVRILDDVNIEIKKIVRPGKVQGQVDALLAPSGCGKSTIFNCVSGLLKPTSGTLTIAPNGDDTLVPIQVGMVGVVAQDYPLFNHRTIWKNLMIAAMIGNTDKEAAEKDINEFLERFQLADKKNLYPYQLSGGQRQRVAIIQQLLRKNHLLLMDEPYSGLDPIMKTEVINLITSISSQNDLNSVIITTHDIQSAIASADTILLLGRNRDTTGAIIPGANIKFTFNLIERGLSWHPDITSMPAFFELDKEIKARFKEL